MSSQHCASGLVTFRHKNNMLMVGKRSCVGLKCLKLWVDLQDVFLGQCNVKCFCMSSPCLKVRFVRFIVESHLQVSWSFHDLEMKTVKSNGAFHWTRGKETTSDTEKCNGSVIQVGIPRRKHDFLPLHHFLLYKVFVFETCRKYNFIVVIFTFI